MSDFSGTTVPRILKFGTNVGYDLLYCVKENQPPTLIITFICPFFLSLQSNFCYRFLSFYESHQSSNFESGQVYCGKENLDAEINFPSFFPSLTPM